MTKKRSSARSDQKPSGMHFPQLGFGALVIFIFIYPIGKSRHSTCAHINLNENFQN